MQILIAYDGSDGADTAVSLVEALGRRRDDRVRLITVLPSPRTHLGRVGAIGAFKREPEPAELREALAAVMAARDRLDAGGLGAVEARLARGRAADTILRESRRLDADLVIVGSRGRGRIASMLLGSVATELVEESPTPVLVARSASLDRVVLATDGSAHALHAEEFLASLSLAPTVPVQVVIVAGEGADGEGPMTAHEQIAAATVRRLAAAGISAASLIRTGEAAAELLAVPGLDPTTLVVLGARGATTGRRPSLGSVARNVLQNSPASVLVVRRGAPRQETITRMP